MTLSSTEPPLAADDVQQAQPGSDRKPALPSATPSDGEVGRGLLALLCVQFLFGMFPVVGKFAFENGAFSPSALAFWRIGVGALVLGAIAFATLGKRALPARAELPKLFLLALLSVALNQGFYLEGLKRSSGTATGLVMCLIPVFTYAVAIVLRQETAEWRRVLGIAIALAGAVPLILTRGNPLLPEFALGIAFLMTNSLVYSTYLVLAKPLMRRHPPLFLVAWIYILSLVALPWFGHGATLVPEYVGHERAWWALAYTLAGPTIVAYLLNAYALARVRASTTAFFIYMQPVITGVGSALWLGERLTPVLGLTAGCMFVGSWLVIQPKSRASAA